MNYDVEELRRVLSDDRVQRAVDIALRDADIVARVQACRDDGMTVEDAVWAVHLEAGLSDEHVRTIYYRKKRRT